MTVLSIQDHGDQGWRQPRGFGFARQHALQPLAVDEVGRVSDGMPVAFRQLDGRWQAVAVMAPVDGLNLYVARDARWRAPFVPAALRVYPFALEDASRALALWPDFQPEPAGAVEVKPFFVSGQLSPELHRVRAFLRTLAEGVNAADAPLRFLDQRGVLRPWSPQPESGKDIGGDLLSGLFQVDTYALDGLSDADWISLRRANALPWLHAHLDSLYHLRRFRTLAASLASPSGEDSTAPEAVAVDDLLAAMANEIDAYQGDQEP
ncbi:SapC family protein [Thioalkalivibrio sp. AKL12]|uniref:SapC family protein n=1 Tax=Thioalkalivibrio sp. AKL12 TaxID=1158159 RepID=UPI0003730414|nr:SapC family protein [Thioalkalivibrio sp. AKL12]